jgi:arginyl-tRNA synthetase
VKQIKEDIKEVISGILTGAALELAGGNRETTQIIGPEQIIVETPPKPELGDLAFPMFPFAKIFKTSPRKIAELVQEKLEARQDRISFRGSAEGPYLNVRIDTRAYSQRVIEEVLEAGEDYGRSELLADTKVMIEFSCPNTNKPLHLGHTRNDAIGESVARLFEGCGAAVRKVNLINDRGIHICKSMLAYKRFGEGKTPESEGIKSDRFVGDYYVAYNKWQEQDGSAEEQAREMLLKWENGDPETVDLWKRMNRWAIEGIEETYKKTGVSFQCVYYESETYKLGKQEVLKGYESGAFYKDESGAVWVDLGEINLDKKVLLRGDGTSLYMTQDLGTAIQRHRDWPFDRMIYVVGSEQQYHFQVLFYILRKLGYDWARDLHHLSYGMVNLTEGKMKSREGTVVDADDLLAELTDLAASEIREKGREEEMENPKETAEKIALGALHFYLLQTSPGKDMIFEPEKSIAFTGSTGPYLQYTCARISTMLGKYEARKETIGTGQFHAELLTVPEEWELIKNIGRFQEVLEKSCTEMNPSLTAAFLYETAKTFSQYYHDNPVLHNEDPDVVATRITLAQAVLQVLKNGLYFINVPFLSSM